MLLFFFLKKLMHFIVISGKLKSIIVAQKLREMFLIFFKVVERMNLI